MGACRTLGTRWWMALLGALVLVTGVRGESARADECVCRDGLRGVHIGHGGRGGRSPHYYFPRGRPHEACRTQARGRYVPRYLRRARLASGGSWRSLRRHLVVSDPGAVFARLDCYAIPRWRWLDAEGDDGATNAPRAQLNEATLALHVGEVEEARRAFKAAATSEAQAVRTPARVGLALCELVAGDYGAARSIILALAKEGILRAEDRVDADVLGDTARWKQAQRVLESYRRFNTADPDGHVAAAWMFHLEGNSKRAEATLALIERRWPEAPWAAALREAFARETPVEETAASPGGDSED